MNSIWKVTALTCGLLIGALHGNASHIMGVDITYVCLGGNDYEFTLRVYRDCDGINPSASYNLDFTSASCGQTFSVNLPQLGTATEVSQICSNQLNQTTCNSGTLPGTEQWTYQANVTLPAQCNDWVISWNDCCRNNAITNLQTPSTRDMFVAVTLDNTGGLCNNSPQYASLPTPYICPGQLFTYNHGAADIDGDSLVYSLAQPLELPGPPGTVIPYTAGYTINDPVITNSGFNFDPLTGTMCFEPNGNQICVISVVIDEYRNGVLIATHIREMQVVVSGFCSNQPPTIGAGGCNSVGAISNLTGGPSAIQLDSNIVSVCPGDSICFDLLSNDPDLDSVFVFSNISTAIPGATLTTDSSGQSSTPISTFCWQPTGVDTGAHIFTVTLSDFSCPIMGVQSFSFIVYVVDATYAGVDQTICGPTTLAPGQAQLQAVGGTSFTWTVISGDPMNVGGNFTCDNCPNPIATPDSTTVYQVSSNLAAGCKSIDTVTVFVVPDFTYAASQTDTAICRYEDVTFSAPGSPAGTYSYSWTQASVFDSATHSTPTATFQNAGNETVYFEITSPDGCAKTDSLSVLVSAGIQPIVGIAGDTTICVGDNTQLGVTYLNPGLPCKYAIRMNDTFGDGWNGAILTFYVNGVPSVHTFATGSQQIDSVAVLHGDIISIDFSSGGFPSEESYQITDASGNILFADGTSPTNGTALWTDTVDCGFSTATYLFDWSPTMLVSDTNTENTIASPTTDTTIQVVVMDSIGGCVDTALVNLIVIPSFTYDTSQTDTAVCLYETVEFTVAPNPTGSYVYDWSTMGQLQADSIDTVVVTFTSPGAQWVYFDVATALGCEKTDSFEVVVSTSIQPNAFVSGDTTICLGDSTQLFATSISGAAGICDDFDPATDPTVWTMNWGQANTTCGAVSGNALYFDAAFRFAETVDIAVPTGGTVSFYLYISDQIGGACEDADFGEDVLLEYSTNGGTSWTLINTYLADNYPTFTLITEPIPALAQTPATRFRWSQPIFTSSGSDNWALDSICITPTANSYTYSWLPTTGVSNPNIDNPIINTTVDATYNVVALDTIGGCTDTTEITVYVVPDISYTAAQSEDSICKNETVQFNLTPDSAGYLYTWNHSEFLDDTTIAGPLGTFDSSGTKWMVYTIESPEGCQKTDSVWVVVSTNPKPNVAISSTKDTICKGDSIDFSSVSLTQTCDFTLTLYDDQGNGWAAGSFVNISINGTPLPNYTLANGDSISYVISIQSGDSLVITYIPAAGADSAQSYTLFNNVGIVVFQDGQGGFPPTPFSIVFNAFVNCQSPLPYLFSWSPSGSLSGATISNPTAIPDTTTTYQLIVTDSIGGCQDSATYEIAVVVLQGLGVTAIDTSFCETDPATAALIGTPANGVWSGSAAIDNAGVYDPATGGVGLDSMYYVVGNASAGCIDSVKAWVEVFANPNQPVSSDQSACAGTNVTLNASASGGSVTWYSDATLTTVVDSGQTLSVIDVQGNSSFWVQTTSPEGCVSSALNVNLTQLPTPNASFTADSMSGYVPLDVQFSNLTSPINSNYVWEINGSQVSTMFDFDTTFSDTGTYVVTLFATENGCTDTFELSVLVEIPFALYIPSVFTPGELDGYNDTWDPELQGIENFSLIIYDRWGHKTYEFSDQDDVWDGNSWMGGPAADGTYYYVLSGENSGQPISQNGYITLIRQ